MSATMKSDDQRENIPLLLVLVLLLVVIGHCEKGAGSGRSLADVVVVHLGQHVSQPDERRREGTCHSLHRDSSSGIV